MAFIVLSAEYHQQPSLKPTHYHDCHQILYIAEGSAAIQINGQIWHATPGCLAVFSRYEHHQIVSCSPDYRRYVLDIAPDVSLYNENCYRIFSLLFNRPEGFRNVLDMQQDSQELEQLLIGLAEEKQKNTLMVEEMLELLLQQLLIRVYRRFPDSLSSGADSAFETVYKLQSRFEKDFRTPFSLAQLAAELDISVSALSHQFKKITGTSVMGYLTACRIAAAKKYLASTAMPIGEIVDVCGFSDASNFSRLFKKLTGGSPSQFRQNYK